MPQRKTAAPKNQPILVSGSVFFLGILAEDYPQARMPAQLQVGDIRLHNVNKKGSRPRFGQTVTFEGFIVASIWDGKKFRKLLLRRLGAAESTHVGPVERRDRALALLRHLKTLVRRQAYWYAQDSGYEVSRDGAVSVTELQKPAHANAKTTVATTPPAPQAVLETIPESAASASTEVTETTVTVTVTVQVDASKPRRRKAKVDDGQLALFPDKT